MKKLPARPRDVHVFVCHGGRCTRNGAPTLRRELVRALGRLGLRAKATRTSCQGRCKEGAIVFVERPRPRVWGGVRAGDVEKLARKLARAAHRGRAEAG